MGTNLFRCPHCGEYIHAGAILCRFCGTGLSEKQFRPCPFCAEMIRAEAILCRFCKTDLPPDRELSGVSSRGETLSEGQESNWVLLQRYKNKNDTIYARVSDVVKGGVVVYVYGVRGFVPATQLRVKDIKPEDLKGKAIPVKITEIDSSRKKLVLSHLLAIPERAAQREKTLATLEAGQTVSGEVVRIADFGAFLDLGGIDGILPISEISWERPAHPSDVLRVGQNVTTRVLRVDKEKGHIGLSLKRMEPDPWKEIEDKFEAGQVITGTVKTIHSFGAFLQIYPGVVALLPTVEISEQCGLQPEETVRVGQNIKVVIKKFLPNVRKITLSLCDMSA
jgi:small subunit ribosomal protein S1